MNASFKSVVFVGTSAGLPTAERNVSCIALKFTNEDTVLIDCGEATQHQFFRCPTKGLLKFSKVKAILITHLHGDHIHGLPGLLSTLQLLQVTSVEHKMNIIAPLGIRDYLSRVIDFDMEQFNIIELEPEQESSGILFDKVSWHAFPVVHSPEVHAYCYAITEEPKEPGLDVARARALGASGKQFGVLKSGKDVTLDDGRVIHCSDVLLPGVPPRRAVFMGDNHCVSEAFVEPFTAYVDGCSLLVDECTFPEELLGKAEKHSTPSIVAKLAKSVHAKKVAITHFSQRITHDDSEPGSITPEHLAEQVKHFLGPDDADDGKEHQQKDSIEVIPAEDYLEVIIPKTA